MEKEMLKIILIEEKLKNEDQLKNGANWFYWIAALSLINTLMWFFDGSFNFIFGLAVTQLVDYFAYTYSLNLGNIVNIFGLVINIVILGVFAAFGYSANNRVRWAFIVGMLVYGFDGLLFVFLEDYMSALFHLAPLFGIYKGLQANTKLTETQEKLNQCYASEQVIPCATITEDIA